jgi:hypothetical protein
MLKKLFCLIMLGCSVQSFSQVKQVARLELEENDDESGNVSVMGDHGFIAHAWGDKSDGMQAYHIVHYSPDLKVLHKQQVQIPKRFSLQQDIVAPDYSKVILLFTGPKDDFMVVTYLPDGKVSTSEGRLPVGIYIRHVVVLENTLFIRGVLKRKHMLLKLDIRTGKYAELQKLTDKTLSFYDMESMPENDLVIVPYTLGKKITEERFFLSFLDENGEKKFDDFHVKADPGKYPLNGSITWLSADHFIIVGSFSNDADRLASGIYLADVQKGKIKYIKYHLFAEMKNFFTYLSKNQQQRVEKKVERKSKKGKENALDVLITSHPVFEHQGNYVYIGEVYYPTYRQEPYTTTGPNGTMVTSYRSVFDGYQYSHAVITAMSPSGEKLWDHCFSMWLFHKPYKPQKNIRVLINGDEIQMLFSTGSSVSSAVVKGKEMSEKNYDRIEGMNEGDKTRWTGVTKTEYWYENYFLTYGWQKIKNTDEKGSKKRKVFFVSKLQFKEQE